MVVFKLWYGSKGLASPGDRGKSVKLRGKQRQEQTTEHKDGGYENKNKRQNNCKRASTDKER